MRVDWAWAAPARTLVHLLGDADLDRLAHTRTARARDHVASGRVLARSAVAGVLGCAPADVVLALPPGARRGRPVVRGSDVSVSITHSAGLVAVAVCSTGPTGAPGDVGIDVERVRPLDDALAQRVLSPAELARHRTWCPTEHDLLTYWCRKEALVKCAGVGLAVRPRTLTTSPPGAPARVTDAGALTSRGPFALRDITVHGGYRAAVAISGGALGAVRVRNVAIVPVGAPRTTGDSQEPVRRTPGSARTMEP